MGFRPPSKPSLFCEAVRHDGVGEGILCKVDEVATSSKKVKMKDHLYSFSVFVRFFCPICIQANQVIMVTFPSTDNRNEVVTGGAA